jgi:hypothetical protein
MKLIHMVMVSAAVLCVSAVPVMEMEGCGMPAHQVVKTVLDMTDVLCITANADLPTPKAVAQACGIAEDLISVVETVLEDFKGKRAAYAARSCGR